MQLAGSTLSVTPLEAPPALIDIVVPVYNEERTLAASVRRLRGYLDTSFPFPTIVTVVDNGSTDTTAAVAAQLAHDLPGVRVLHLDAKGRGRALRAAWSDTTATVVAYMDVDLSTSLDALLPLVAPLLSGHSDIAIGSRLARGARVVRSPKREIISRLYNVLLKTCLQNGFSDAQCGFKAVRTTVARQLLPQVEDNAWFFDTELLVRAEQCGLRIHEVPVDWVDDLDSRVDIISTAKDDLKGIVRLLVGKEHGPARQPGPAHEPVSTSEPVIPVALARYARIGLVSTAFYLALFFALHAPLGAFGANAMALALCTLGNAAAHRRLTFAGQPARRDLVLGGAVALAISIAFSSLALACTGWLQLNSALDVIVALIAANAVSAMFRFVVLHFWMFRSTWVVRTTPLSMEVPS